MTMFWQLLTCGAAVVLALNTEHEIKKAIQFLRESDVQELPSPQVRVVSHNRIRPVPLGRHPYAVMTIIKDDNAREVCSGIIVSTRFVLTSGECVPGEQVKYHEGIVLAGDVNYTRNKTFEKSNVQIRTVKQYFYSGKEEVIVLLKLHLPFVLHTRYVDVAVLTPDRKYDADLNISATAVGFADVGTKEGVMSAYKFWTIPGANCSSDLGRPVLCSRDDPLKSVCNADRGGPLIVHNSTVYGFIRGREFKDLGSQLCGSEVLYNTFWFAGGYAEWIKLVVEDPAEGRLQGGLPSLAVAVGCWRLPCLLSCSINLLLSR